MKYQPVVPEPGGPVGPLAPPIFGRSVNPIRIGEGRLSPPITTGPFNVFHLPASLNTYDGEKWSRNIYFEISPIFYYFRKGKNFA